ncbi:hypothetical protein NDN08_005907 [Rhodosorus marinus]|uniref:AB hydrolase-1 domain-containing protein n=1 Tax=Rhodosorus marinus TaxID=101924 RepID=A0AAV8V2Y8_9RHOD|nr:hypothetical protein NDN08_005907 [Rhodosorus marinus]
MSGEVGEDGGVIATLKSLPKAAKIALAAGSAIGSSLALAGLFESFIRFMEEKRFKPPGKFLETSKGAVHYVYRKCTSESESKDRPILILDAGLGCWSLVFRMHLEEFAEVTDVLALDRYGYGHSSYVNDGSNRIVDHVDNLETVLKLLEIDQPILFVAHSLAGVSATYFALKNKPRMAGVVYIDAMTSGGAELMAEKMPPTKNASKTGYLGKFLSHVGGLRLLTYLGKLPTVGAYARELLPELVRTTTKWEWFSSFKMDFESCMECYGLVENQVTEKFVHESEGCLDDIPIAVLMPDFYLHYKLIAAETLEKISQAQKNAANFSSDSKFVLIEDCSHWVMWDKPEVVLDTVLDVISRYEKSIENRILPKSRGQLKNPAGIR